MKLELEAAVNCPVGVENQTWILGVNDISPGPSQGFSKLPREMESYGREGGDGTQHTLPVTDTVDEWPHPEPSSRQGVDAKADGPHSQLGAP